MGSEGAVRHRAAPRASASAVRGTATGPTDGVQGKDAACYTVSVRNLCAFAARHGDLDLRFTPSPTAQQGRLGHQRVAQRRPAGYEAELSLEQVVRGLRVRGRADGFDPASNTLDEVKTFRGALEAIPPHQQALHWAQAKVYGALLCRLRGLDALTLRLVYFEIGQQSEHPLVQRCTAQALWQFLDDLCQRFVCWARQEQAHRQARDALLAQLAFPQPPFRPGQRALAGAVYRACQRGQTLLVQAPTGIGKTIGTLFPALHAVPRRGTDKLFFLTARTPGRAVALDALRTLREGMSRGGAAGAAAAGRTPPAEGALRVLELVAREKSCEHPDKACHPDSCPLARGFYDRLAPARAQAAQRAWLDRQALREVALAHAICPYYLGHEMLRWSDVVVADYNYYFDRSALLHAMTLENQWRVTLLVDEAHNLVPRGRSMYSADLTHAETLALRTQVPAPLRVALDALLDQWQLLLAARQRLQPPAPWSALEAVPQPWLRALQRLCVVLGEHLNAQSSGGDRLLLAFHFRALALLALAESFGPHSWCEFDGACSEPLPVSRRAGRAGAQEEADAAQLLLDAQGFDAPGSSGRLSLRNIVPGPFLAPRIGAADSAILFSATLHPAHYFTAMLGLPEDTPRCDLPSPFRPEQLQVRIVPVSTRRADRLASLDTLVAAMAAQFACQRGNYLAFFSSFDYLELACARLRQSHPSIPVWAQERQMDEPARQAFLRRFDAAGSGIGFAVLGGVFGEGVDLPGRRLIGAFIVTLGLPQFDAAHALVCARMEELFGRGHEFTYVVPGLQKVVQAAGRVIRSATDTGCVILLDARYREPRYRALLPSWWNMEVAA